MYSSWVYNLEIFHFQLQKWLLLQMSIHLSVILSSKLLSLLSAILLIDHYAYQPFDLLHDFKAFWLLILILILKLNIKMCQTANEILNPKIMFHPYIQDVLWKNFQDWCLPDRRNPILRFPPVEGRVCLYNCSYSSRSLPALEEILELDCACQEDTNLVNFFTEHLVYMDGTLFWGSKFHSQEYL